MMHGGATGEACMIVTDGVLLHQDSMGGEISKEYVLYRDEDFELLLLANDSFKRAHLISFSCQHLMTM